VNANRGTYRGFHGGGIYVPPTLGFWVGLVLRFHRLWLRWGRVG